MKYTTVNDEVLKNIGHRPGVFFSSTSEFRLLYLVYRPLIRTIHNILYASISQ